ncbi:heavy metal translocating P-type ATPase [Shewanella surugensis]|uniref:Heavy metal translocating P-type ATPase n=1 Tax=Shewanella surugensis TaxID=212020 RepID=A0ABT0LE59_9GAMM|nr:heavy metal translocating P-type ATPase [Shewanella surugensis]MCL1125984.1 heavy metal translocating P-type ATPase [Shewanella surugensis]
MTTQTRCFHCGEAVLSGKPLYTRIQDHDEAMCCLGCQAVSAAIVNAGLLNYYQFRTELGGSQQQLIPAELSHFSAYDLPEIQEEFVYQDEYFKQVSLTLEGLTCAACSWLIEHKLKQLTGIESISVNSTTERALIRWDPNLLQLSDILNQITHIGYQAFPFQVDEQEINSKKESRQFLLRLGLAGFATMQVMMFALALYSGFFTDLDSEFRDYFRWVSMLFAAPVVFYSAQPFYFSAIRALLMGRINMDVSVSIAICGAYIASCLETIRGSGEVYFESVSMFTFFLLLGRYFEQNARQKASVNASNLHKLIPLTANKISDTGMEEVPAKRLIVGDVILIKPGEIVAGDGKIIEGSSSINESMLTGEQLPIIKKVDSLVYAGTINIDHPLKVKVTAVGQEQLVADIIRLQEIASHNKPKIALYADTFSNYFTAGVLLLASLSYLFWSFYSPEDAFWITLSVLVATCPCALALATPTAITCSTSILTRLGIIARKNDVFEKLPLIKHVVFDKTGTLTCGQLTIDNLTLFGMKTEHTLTTTPITVSQAQQKQHILTIAAALEAHSLHPIASAFMPYQQQDIVASHCENKVGLGIAGTIQGAQYKLGSAEFVGAHTVQDTPSLTYPLSVETTDRDIANDPFNNQYHVNGQDIWLSENNHILAKIQLSDKLRPDASIAIKQLQNMGCQVSMATGDTGPQVLTLANKLNIKNVHQNLKPNQKLELINALQQEQQTAMFGDGINDAPVLAGANLSVAMGSGAAITKNSADLILLGDHLSRFSDAILVAKKTKAIIQQNLFWAIGYNVLIIPLAMTGNVLPYVAALGMSASSLIVVSNSLRLLKVKV